MFALLLCGTPAPADGCALSSGNVVVVWQAFFLCSLDFILVNLSTVFLFFIFC